MVCIVAVGRVDGSCSTGREVAAPDLEEKLRRYEGDIVCHVSICFVNIQAGELQDCSPETAAFSAFRVSLVGTAFAVSPWAVGFGRDPL